MSIMPIPGYSPNRQDYIDNPDRFYFNPLNRRASRSPFRPPQAFTQGPSSMMLRAQPIEYNPSRGRLYDPSPALRQTDVQPGREVLIKALPGRRRPPPKGQDLSKPVKDFVDVGFAYSRVVSSASDVSGASDLSLIFNFMKVLDPGSVVREGEFATAQNTGGVDQKIIGLYNRIREGDFLTPKQRADFLNVATRLYRGAEDQYKSIAEQYSNFAKEAGLDPALVIPDFGFKGELPATPTILQVPENPDTARFPKDEDWKKHWQTVMTEEQRREFLEG